MLIPSDTLVSCFSDTSLSRRVNANSQREVLLSRTQGKLIKKGEC